MGQIMQRLLEGVQAELQAEERDLCAHLNAQAHLLTLEAHLDCLEADLADIGETEGKGKGKQGSPPGSPVASDSTMKGKRKLSAGELTALAAASASTRMLSMCVMSSQACTVCLLCNAATP